MEWLLYTIVPTLALLAFFGWRRDQKWARIALVLYVIILLCAAFLLAMYLNAMGQADWSL